MVDVLPAVLALSKATWKLSSSLSRLVQDTRIIDTAVRSLADELKSLGNECDLVYAEMEEIASKSDIRPSLACDVDTRLWECLARQAEECTQTIQKLELCVKGISEEDSCFVSQIERQRKLDRTQGQLANSRTDVRRHTDNFHTTLLVIHT